MMASLNNVSDRCVICFSEIKTGQRKSNKRSRTSSSSAILKQLDTIFILSKLLEVPVHNMQTYLMSWGSPETWIAVCQKCEVLIEDTKQIHCEVICALQRFKKLKRTVIEVVKQSKANQDATTSRMEGEIWKIPNPKRMITDQIRNFVSVNVYGDLTDPFLIGDRKANELIKKKILQPFIVVNTEIAQASIVKMEPDFDDNDNDNQHLLTTDAEITDCHYNEFEIDHYKDNVDETNPKEGFSLSNVAGIEIEPPTEHEKHMLERVTANTKKKFCEECQVHFPANKFEEHYEYLHLANEVGAPQEDSLKQFNVEGTLHANNVVPAFPSEDKQVRKVTVAGRASNSCSKCQRKFSNKEDLWVHQSLHKTSPFHCHICLSVHKNKDNLRFHLWKHHPSTRTRKNRTSKTKQERAVVSKRKKIKCSKCTLYISPVMMQEHLNLHERSTCECPDCGNVFVNERKLKQHLAKYHRATNVLQKHTLESSKALERDSDGVKKKSSRDVSYKTDLPSMDSVLSESDADDDKMDTDDVDWRPENVGNLEVPSRSTCNRTRRMYKIRKARNCIVCPLCEDFEYTSGEAENLMIHFEGCKGKDDKTDDELVCPLCIDFKVQFSQKLDYCEHLLVCKDNGERQQIPLTHRIFECNLCLPKQYFRVDNFIKHFKDHAKTVYKCTKCPKRFAVTSHVSHHWRKFHVDAYKSVQPLYRYTRQPNVPEFSWWCRLCSEKFLDEASRDAHILTSHEQELTDMSFICTICSKAYSCDYELKLHKGTAHAMSNLNLMTCDICKQVFKTLLQLKNHRMKRHRVDLLICDICGIECNSSKNLNNHMQLHTQVRKHVCQHCGESFTVAQYLQNHIYKMHTPHDAAANPLFCTICGKTFSSKYYLNEHRAGVHEKQYKFHCPICNIGSQSRCALKRHMARLHKIGEQKVYGCTVKGCNKKFATPGRLKTHHVATHIGERQFSCRHCGKEFYDTKYLQRHEQIHTNAESKPYQCELCAKRFPVRNYLYIHMKSHRIKK